MVTLEDYYALEKAIGTGAKSVYYATGRVDYHSIDEMFKALNYMATKLGLTPKTPRFTNPTYDKGV
jgi:hypothetical protein